MTCTHTHTTHLSNKYSVHSDYAFGSISVLGQSNTRKNFVCASMCKADYVTLENYYPEDEITLLHSEVTLLLNYKNKPFQERNYCNLKNLTKTEFLHCLKSDYCEVNIRHTGTCTEVLEEMKLAIDFELRHYTTTSFPWGNWPQPFRSSRMGFSSPCIRATNMWTLKRHWSNL